MAGATHSIVRASMLVRFLAAALTLPISISSFAGSISLMWDPVFDPALAGYMLYYGPSAGSYTSKVDVGNTTAGTLPGLTDGATYHFAVRAYDAARQESAFSNDIAVTVPGTMSSVPSASFNATPVAGIAPLNVNFSSTSTGQITGYVWDFGDG